MVPLSRKSIPAPPNRQREYEMMGALTVTAGREQEGLIPEKLQDVLIFSIKMVIEWYRNLLFYMILHDFT